jgi:hypothetical protein
MKFGWRWFLPVFFIILFVTLAVIHWAQNSSTSSSYVAWSGIEMPVSLDTHALRILVIPVFLFIVILVLLAQQLGASQAIQLLLFYITIAVGIPFMWYLVGRWIDTRLGYLPEGPVRHPVRTHKAITRILLVMTILAFVLLLIALTLDWVVDEDVLLSGILWTIFFSVVLVNKLRHWRNLNPPEKL